MIRRWRSKSREHRRQIYTRRTIGFRLKRPLISYTNDYSFVHGSPTDLEANDYCCRPTPRSFIPSDYEAIILPIAIKRGRGGWERILSISLLHLNAIVWVSPRGISIWRARKSRAHIQAMGTPSRERKSDQYWSLIEVVRVSNIYQYWSERRPVLVTSLTSTGWNPPSKSISLSTS